MSSAAAPIAARMMNVQRRQFLRLIQSPLLAAVARFTGMMTGITWCFSTKMFDMARFPSAARGRPRSLKPSPARRAPRGGPLRRLLAGRQHHERRHGHGAVLGDERPVPLGGAADAEH